MQMVDFQKAIFWQLKKNPFPLSWRFLETVI